MTKIVPLAQLKVALGVSGSSEDAILTQLEAFAADWVERQLAQRFQQPAETTEYLKGRGTTRLILAGHVGAADPVVTVTEKFSAGGTPQAFTAFERRGDVLVRTDGAPWYDGAEYAVTYLDGYLEAPGDVQLLVADLVGKGRSTAIGAAGLESETIGDYSYQLAADAIGTLESLSTSSQRTLDSRRPNRI
jgi:hypothetical protein